MNTTQLIGREGELERISTVLESDGDARVVMLTGDAGVGKSTLLKAVGAAAAGKGFRVLRGSGAESEVGLPYASLHQLIHPLLNYVDGLGTQHRTSIAQALGTEPGLAPSPLSLGGAVVDLLSLAASREPLLLVIDDVQWLDPSSAETLAFVLRRLADYDVSALLALRADQQSVLERAQLSTVEILPLGREDATRLLARSHPDLEAETRELVLGEAAGNPLALEELPQALRSRAPAVYRPSAGIPLSRKLEAIYGNRLETLSTAVKSQLLRAALDGMRAGIDTGSNISRYRIRDIDGAVELGLLVVDPATGEIAFRHPLVRSAVVQSATPNELRTAHASLAEAHRGDPERFAWHLGAAIVDPDEGVAAAFDEAARVATRRGSASVAIAALTRAAELSPKASDRSRRLAEAAYIAGQSAQLDRAALLLEEAAYDDVQTGSASSIISATYINVYRNGDPGAAHRRLLELSTRDRESLDSETLTRLMNLLITVSIFAGSSPTWERTCAEVDSYGDRVDPTTRLHLDACGDLLRNGFTAPERLADAFARSASAEPWHVMRLTVAAFYLDVLNDYRPSIDRMLNREGESGAVGNLMTVMQIDMLDQMWSGRWSDAAMSGAQGMELTSRHGYWMFHYQFRAFAGVVAAVRGDEALAEEHSNAVEQWARPRGVGFLTAYYDLTRTLSALAKGDYETAYVHAISVTPPGSFTPHSEQAPRMLLDFVEAAVHTGRIDQARAHAEAARDVGFEQLSPRLRLMTLGALALSSGDDTARALFEEALAAPSADHFPFELNRIRLAYGIWLRRQRENTAAAFELGIAASAFRRMGAQPWADRANVELRAGGVDVRSTTTAEDLTPQEREIAELAASGLSNKKIGERLFLSPRTVSWHLYRIFPKLGITSRASLRDSL